MILSVLSSSTFFLPPHFRHQSLHCKTHEVSHKTSSSFPLLCHLPGRLLLEMVDDLPLLIQLAPGLGLNLLHQASCIDCVHSSCPAALSVLRSSTSFLPPLFRHQSLHCKIQKVSLKTSSSFLLLCHLPGRLLLELVDDLPLLLYLAPGL